MTDPNPFADRAPADAGAADDGTWSVPALAGSIGEQLRVAFPDEVWVRGELRDLNRPPSGHVYFALVGGGTDGQPQARVQVMLGASERPRVNRILRSAGGAVRMTDGTEVRIRGRVSWFAPRGQLQLRMTSIDPAFTLGRLAADRAELLARLSADGILRANASVPFPEAPLRIGLVTSATSAAEADVRHELERSGFRFEVQVADVRVQGHGAAASIAGAIRWFASRDVDALVVVRGGGSATDLAAFDHEEVARAICTSPHPVVTGIGHEIDRSVADEVAHVSAKTPTAAAQLLVGRVAAAAARAERAWAGVERAAQTVLHRADERLAATTTRAQRAARVAAMTEAERLDHRAELVLAAVASQVTRWDAHLDAAAARLVRAGTQQVDAHERRLDLLAVRVGACDPVHAVRRGWSITRTVDGRLVRSVGDVQPGDVLETVVADGALRSEVIEPHRGRAGVGGGP